MERLYALLIAMCLSLTACATQKKSLAESKTEPPPKLLAPNVRKVWIPAQIKDGGQEWEEGHFLYRIERGTSWSR